MMNAFPLARLVRPRGSEVTSNLRFLRYVCRPTIVDLQLARLSFLRHAGARLSAVDFAAVPFRALPRPRSVAAPPRSACTLRRNASIRLTTLVGCGVDGVGGFLPACLAAISALSARS